MAPPAGPGGSSDSSYIIKDRKSFFDVLPRELRDRVYGFTFDHDIADGHFKYHFKAPQSHLRLVSRQFMHEYDEQTPTNATLFVIPCTNQFTYADDYLPASYRIPGLVSRCTALDVFQYVGDTDAFNDDIKGEQFEVLNSLGIRMSDLLLFIRRLDHLRDVYIRFNLNFAQNFDKVYERTEMYLAGYRCLYEMGDPEISHLPDLTFEMRHLDLNFPGLPSCLTPNIADFGILQQPATLAAFYYSYRCRGMIWQNWTEVNRRCHVELSVLNAWEAQHGCKLSKSAKTAVASNVL